MKAKHSKEFLQLKRRIFSKPPRLTEQHVEQLWRSYCSLPDSDKRTVFSGIFGSMRARRESPHTAYQYAARLFFREVSEMFEYIERTNKAAVADPKSNC